MADSSSTPAPEPLPRLTSDGEGARMGFMDHLMELRKRLWIVVVTLLVCMTLALTYCTELFQFMRAPADDLNRDYAAQPDIAQTLKALELPPGSSVIQITSTDPLDTTIMLMWIGLWAGVILSAPMILYQVWAFIAPGLRQREKRAITPILYGGIIFFLAGCAAAYYVLFPVSLQFFVWLNTLWHVRTLWSVERYVSLLINLMLITGLICEIPLVIGVLAKLGLVRPRHLLVYWRHLVLASFILGAVLSPGTDVISMLVFTAMILSIYIASIVMTLIFYKAPPA